MPTTSIKETKKKYFVEDQGSYYLVAYVVLGKRVPLVGIPSRVEKSYLSFRFGDRLEAKRMADRFNRKENERKG